MAFWFFFDGHIDEFYGIIAPMDIDSFDLCDFNPYLQALYPDHCLGQLKKIHHRI